MTCSNKANLSSSDIALRGLNTINFIVANINPPDLSALDDIDAKITCRFRIAPSHPIMFRYATTWLISCPKNRVPNIWADIDDWHQLLHLFRSKPLTVDPIQCIRKKIAAFRSYITD